MVTPEDNKIIVFNNGKPQGSNGLIFCGGHTHPISIAADKLP